MSTVKHTHHHQIELDPPGKDSHRHRAPALSEVIIASDYRLGAHRLLRAYPPACRSSSGSCGRWTGVLVEGFKQLDWLRRVEVFRGAGEPLVLADPGIAAVAVPAGVRLQGYHGVQLPLDDIGSGRWISS